MKRTEKTLIIIFVIAIVLRFLHISGGGALTVFSLIPLSFIYNFLAFALFNNIRLRNIFKKASCQGISSKRMIGTIVLGFALSEIVMAICFKLQRWELNSNLYIMIGLFFTVIILIVAIVAYSKNKTSFYNGILVRSIIIGVLGIMVLLMSGDTIIQIIPPIHKMDTEQGNN